MNLNQFDGFLFDMDGTLLDSTQCIEGIWRRWARSKELDPDWVLQHVHGRRGVETIRLVAPHLNAEDIVLTLLEEEASTLEGTVMVPGASAFLAKIADRPWGIVTSAPRQIALAKLHYVGLPIPTVLIAAEDVINGKPHPEPYLLGAIKLECQPKQILAFEDAPIGIQSAIAAGMKVQALATSHSLSQLENATWVVANYDELLLKISS